MTTEQSTSPAAQGNQNGLATASLVTGIVGVVFAFLFSIVGLVLGVVATALARPPQQGRPGRQDDGRARPRAIIAIVVSVVMMVIAYNVLT